MARVMEPVCAIRYEQSASFPLKAVEVFHHYDLMEDDCYTYTIRGGPPHEDDLGEIRQALKERLGREEAGRPIDFLDAHDWDVSFFVDSYEEKK
jgi:hypothetical protein